MRSPRRVVVVCFPGVELLDVAGPVNVLTAATRLAPHTPGYHVQVIAEAPGVVATAGGVELLARGSLRGQHGPIDTLLVPGGLLQALEAAAPLLAHLRQLARRARRVVGVCSGALLLADAGLLDGRRAVTHWAACDELRRRHPRCRVEDDRIFVRDGRIWTSAGVTAGMDLALALVEDDHGAALALEVARWLVMYLRRPGGQSQFSAPLATQVAGREPIAALVEWLCGNLQADLSVGALAQRAAMSERTFARAFTAATRATPAAFVQRQRLAAARTALESTRVSVKEIAARCGFGTAATMHRTFQRALGSTPLAYRARFTRTPSRTRPLPRAAAHP
jgi:transcriptional regulator GlxA family with amidase domain